MQDDKFFQSLAMIALFVVGLGLMTWAKAAYEVERGVRSVLDAAAILMLCDGVMKWGVIGVLLLLVVYLVRKL